MENDRVMREVMERVTEWVTKRAPEEREAAIRPDREGKRVGGEEGR